MEYIQIFVAATTGKISVKPLRPDTGTAPEGGLLIDAVNKMAEYGYRLLPGTVLVVPSDGADHSVFMYRED